MGLGICFDERYETITCVMNDSTNTNLASVLAVTVIMFQNNDWLSLTLARVFNITSVEVAVIAVVSANWAETFL